jgi:hypothetical protein
MVGPKISYFREFKVSKIFLKSPSARTVLL